MTGVQKPKRTGQYSNGKGKQSGRPQNDNRAGTQKSGTGGQPVNKKMSSITRSLFWSGLWEKVGLYIKADLVLFLAIVFGFVLDREYAKFGNISFRRWFYFTWKGGLEHLTMVLTDHKFEKVYYREVCYYPFLALTALMVTVIFLQFMHLVFSAYSEHRKIRKILKPINDLALKADELNRFSFSDTEKYHRLEEAIGEIDPEHEGTLHLGDSDLAGIEGAMNNLIIRMRDSYKQQARFVNDASHELRTPIAVIKGYANMLERWGREDEKVLDESVTAISHEAEHMNILVEQLLFLARGDAGRTKLSMEEISLNELMQEIYEESLMIDENHIYRFRQIETAIRVWADPTMLKQAIRILVDNAAKYTKEKDEIILSLGYDENRNPYLQVQDTGIGMKEADVMHMFERFYRSDEVRSYNGTGLGLSIAKWIVDKHRGHFRVLSREGLGTRIRVVLDRR